MKLPSLALAIGLVAIATAAAQPDGTEIGMHTCVSAPNSTSVLGGYLTATGSTSIDAGDLVLNVSRIPKNELCLLVAGLSGPQLPFGDGFLCLNLAPGVLRLNSFRSDPNGIASAAVDYTAGTANLLMPGLTRTFHVIYRDGRSIGAQVNATNGVEVTFAP